MEIDLLLPLFWSGVFGAILFFGLRKLSKKAPTDKKWVRPEPDKDKNND
tara:strand:- start:1709 stop:1855 length:147 start_codon:yes stop_codon:yes gene_type:complete